MRQSGGRSLVPGSTGTTPSDFSKGKIGPESVRGRPKPPESLRGRIRRTPPSSIYSLKTTPKSRIIHDVFARQILIRRSARCSSSLAATAATMTAVPSGRFSARFAAPVADTSIHPALLLQGRFFLKVKRSDLLRSLRFCIQYSPSHLPETVSTALPSARDCFTSRIR